MIPPTTRPISVRKLVAWCIGWPIIVAGLIVVSPLAILFFLVETIKWAVLNVYGDYEWGSE
jgi:hypothetical protein